MVAAGYADNERTLVAVDIIVNGVSLSERLDSAPYDVDEVVELHLDRAWLSAGQDVPLFNCICGDPGCEHLEISRLPPPQQGGRCAARVPTSVPLITPVMF